MLMTKALQSRAIGFLALYMAKMPEPNITAVTASSTACKGDIGLIWTCIFHPVKTPLSVGWWLSSDSWCSYSRFNSRLLTDCLNSRCRDDSVPSGAEVFDSCHDGATEGCCSSSGLAECWENTHQHSSKWRKCSFQGKYNQNSFDHLKMWITVYV